MDVNERFKLIGGAKTDDNIQESIRGFRANNDTEITKIITPQETMKEDHLKTELIKYGYAFGHL